MPLLRCRAAFFALFFLCLLPLCSHAQVSATLSGRVTDPTGAVIQGATVTANSNRDRTDALHA